MADIVLTVTVPDEYVDRVIAFMDANHIKKDTETYKQACQRYLREYLRGQLLSYEHELAMSSISVSPITFSEEE